MEKWERDFKWLQVRHFIKEALKSRKLPNLNSILLSIGINEVGITKEEFSKSEKQDLMHVAVCTLLGRQGYYELTHHDEEGWPHFKLTKSIDVKGEHEQGEMLKECIIDYFENKYNLSLQSE